MLLKRLNIFNLPIIKILDHTSKLLKIIKTNQDASDLQTDFKNL